MRCERGRNGWFKEVVSADFHANWSSLFFWCEHQYASIDGAPPPLFAEIRECWRVWGNVTCDPSGHGVVGTITKTSKSEVEHRHCYLCPLVAGLHRAFPLRAPASSFTCDCKITHLLYRKPLDFFSCHKNHNCFFSSSMSLTISHSGRRTAASEAHFIFILLQPGQMTGLAGWKCVLASRSTGPYAALPSAGSLSCLQSQSYN